MDFVHSAAEFSFFLAVPCSRRSRRLSAACRVLDAVPECSSGPFFFFAIYYAVPAHKGASIRPGVTDQTIREDPTTRSLP